MDRIHIRGLRHSAFYSPLLMTMAGGFLRDEGVDATYDVAGPGKGVPEGIRDGTVQLAQSAVSTSFAPLERGETVPYVHFAQINQRDGFFLAGRRPEPGFTWDRLTGTNVLVDHFFQPLAMFRYALHREGVDINGVNLVDAGDVVAMDRAFRAGEGDYVHQQGPAPQQLEKDGVGHVVASVGAAIGPVAFSSLCASREWLQTAAARAFMRAYRRARAFAQSAPAEEIAAAEAHFFPAIDRAVLARTIGDYQKLGCWTGSVRIDPGSYEVALDVFDYSGLISRRFGYDEVICAPPGEDDNR